MSTRPPHNQPATLDRRSFLATATAATLATAPLTAQASADEGFRLRYLVGSSLFGYADLAQIVPQVPACGAAALDIWPKVHGNQREQLDEMGEAAFAELLAKHDVTLGCITQYKLGPFGLQNEMRLAQRLGCRLIVTGGKGPVGLRGSELKAAVGHFVEQLKPHLAVAEQCGVTIAIENHGNNLIESPDAIRWLAELRPSNHLAIALAPYHLPQDPERIAGLIHSLGDATALFYAWQHGNGSTIAQPKEQELLQLPGRGELDFAPIIAALRAIQFRGWTEVFMHAFPRGLPMVEGVSNVTAEIKRSAAYLDALAAN